MKLDKSQINKNEKLNLLTQNKFSKFGEKKKSLSFENLRDRRDSLLLKNKKSKVIYCLFNFNLLLLKFKILFYLQSIFILIVFSHK